MNRKSRLPRTNQEAKSNARRDLIRAVILVLTVGTIFAILFFLPVKTYLVSVLKWTGGLGMWGPIVVALSYIAACVLFLPGSILTLGAGFLFGVINGTLTVSIGSTLGAGAAFLVGRTLLREWVEKKVSGNARFNAIDAAVGDQGFKIVFLTRLSPVLPFNLLNYAFGLTRVSFWRYFFASWIGMVPGTVMYVYFGSALRSLTDVAAGKIERGAAQQIFFWVGLAATIVVVVIITRIAAKAFKEAVPETENN